MFWINPARDTRSVRNVFTLTAENADGQAVRWSSSNNAIATVDEATGVVTGVSPGIVTITARAGNRTATSTVLIAPRSDESDITRRSARWYREQNIGWPFSVTSINGRLLNNISSWFGPRTGNYLHLGIDITTGVAGEIHGTPLYAVVSGTVVSFGTNRNASQGYYISIESNIWDPSTNQYLIFTYMHMAEPPPTHLRQVGAPVLRARRVGSVGNTGSVQSQGHLHFEVSNSGNVWGPTATFTTCSRVRRHIRATHRINPIYFYPAGTFRGNLNIWNERRPQIQCSSGCSVGCVRRLGL